MIRVAIQGDPGAFSHLATLQLIGPEVELLPCRTFGEAFQAVRDHRVDRAVIPVENSIAGPVAETLDLLANTELCVCAGTQLRVELCLVTRPGASMPDLATVASHPVALRQCRRLFAEHPAWIAKRAFDTAGSVRELMTDDGGHHAAVASSLAAEIYGAQIVRRGVEDEPHNFTRFLEIGPA